MIFFFFFVFLVAESSVKVELGVDGGQAKS